MSEPDPSTPDFFAMTKAQLLAYAQENEIEGVSSSMLKADILAVIEKAVSE